MILIIDIAHPNLKYLLLIQEKLIIIWINFLSIQRTKKLK
jgi:hypothetical protein